LRQESSYIYRNSSVAIYRKSREQNARYVEVQSSNVYQLIPFARIKENIKKAKNREEFSEFKFELHESEGEEFDGEENWNKKSLETDGDFLVCIKSLTVVLVDEKGFLDMQ